MAEETLRRSLDRAFDPGPDFPDRLLLSRTMAALETTATRPRRRGVFRWSPRAMTLIGAAIAAALVVTVTGAFLAINEFARHAVPAGKSHATPGVVVKTVVGFSAFSAEDAAVWGPYNSMLRNVDPLDSSGLLITHDGGKTWLASGIQSDVPDTETVSWGDSNHIAVADPNSIRVTSDGGLSWHQIQRPRPSPANLGIAPTVRISGSTIFWIPDELTPYHVYFTRDSGANWTTAVLPPPPGGWPNGIWFQYAGPFMFDDRGVFGISSPAMPSTLVYTTSDGGQTWSVPISQAGASLVAVSPGEWWIVDHNGIVYRTVNAGKSWEPMSINPRYSGHMLTSVFPAGGSVLWGTADGTMGSSIPIRSTDSGSHWSGVKLPTVFVG
jgi:hypothetical protein